MAREREVKVTVLGDSSSGRHALSQLDDQATRTGNHFDGLGGKLASFGKVAALGLAGAAVGVGGFLAKAVSSASDLEETLSKVGVVFGEAKDQVVADADFMAKSFGIPKQAFLDASASIGLIGKASGLAKAEVAPFSTGLARLATDASSFFNVPLEEALMAIQSGLTGEAEPLRRFGVLLNEAAVEDEALRLGLIQTGEEMTDGIKVQARASLITKGLADANGDLERTQGSLSNRLRELKGRAENFAASVGSAVIPMLLRFMDLGERVGSVVGPALKGIFDIFAKGDFTGGFAALGIGEDSPIIASMFHIREAVLDAWPKIKETILNAVDAIVGWVREHWPEIRKIITETMETVRDLIAGVVDVITTIWENFGDQIKDVIAATWRQVRDTIEGALRIIQGIVKVVTGLIHGDWGQVWEGIKAIVSGAWEVIKAQIDKALNVIKNVVSVGMEIVSAVFSGAWDAIFEFARGGVAKIVDVFLAMVGHIIHAADSAFGWIPGIGPKLHEARVEFDDFRDSVNESLSGIHDKTVNVRVNHVDNYAVTYGPGYTGGDNASGVYALGLEKGPIPGSGPVPIIAHGGEYVVTPEQMARLRGGGVRGSDGAWAGGGGSDAAALEAAFARVIAPLVSQLQRANVTVNMAEKQDAMLVAREISWAQS